MTEHWMGIATIIALLLGPAIAVGLTRYIDNLRADKVRKLDIFRTLMRTRGMPLSWEHVGALNLIEIEFRKNTEVITAWKSYLENLGTELPPIEQKAQYDEACRKRDSQLTKLIHEIAKVVGIEVEQLDILEGNYIPQGWADSDWEQKLVRRGLINFLHGKISIPIHVKEPVKTQSNYPSPPPPSPPPPLN